MMKIGSHYNWLFKIKTTEKITDKIKLKLEKIQKMKFNIIRSLIKKKIWILKNKEEDLPKSMKII